MAPGGLLHYPFGVRDHGRTGTGNANAGAIIQACRRLPPAI